MKLVSREKQKSGSFLLAPPITNCLQLATKRLISVGDEILEQKSWQHAPTLLTRFEGGGFGARSMHCTSGGVVLLSPEGTQLRDDLKGLWRSADNGVTWHRTLSLSGYPNPVCIWGICEDDSGGIYAGVYIYRSATRVARIFRSTDHGESWKCVFHDREARHIHCLAWDAKANAIYAALGDDSMPWKRRAIVRSQDRGSSWVEILVDIPQISAMACTDHGRLLGSDVPKRTAIFYTNDDQRADAVLSMRERLFFFWMRSDGMRVFAGTVAAVDWPTTAKLLYSDDGGATWDTVATIRTRSQWDGFPNAGNMTNEGLYVAIRCGGKTQQPLFLPNP